ncbi:MAG TPA: hypothetical protein VN841_05850 [Bryobacteraceae bacterium]|nr:hypothetical protein [Bryobacteraceae bacterium]
MILRIQEAACLLVTLAFPIAAWADITNQSVTLNSGQTLNLDTGAVGTSGGDILWTGSITTGITLQGNATGYGFPASTLGMSAYTALTQQQLAGEPYSKSPITTVNVLAQWIIAVHTNGGNYAKLIVTASSTSITFEYTTFGGNSSGGGGGGAGAPTISQVQNNYSFILPGLPNYGIAPGSLFIVKGTNLATNTTPVLQSLSSPLPTSLNGASISVTVGGTTVTPALYYTSTGQLGAVLPSTTPVGTGTITVTNSGQTSSSAQMVVVASALGLDVATDANVNYFAQAASASPGQTIILWGSGVGADTANDDKTYPLKQDNLTTIPMQVWIGGIQATIQYRGRSQYPGVDQVNVVIPSNVPVGCGVSIVAVSGNIVSNSITVPVAPGGGACSDPASPTNAGLLQSLTGKAKVSFGFLEVIQSTEVTAATGKTTSNEAFAGFFSYPGAAFLAAANASASIPSIGSCIIIGGGGVGLTPTGLDPGTITFSGGGTPSTTLQSIPSEAGDFYAMISAVPSSGATYTFTGSGGKDVGSFNTTLNFPTPLVWTNQSSITTVNRAQGQTVTWTGGAPGTFVSIGGQSELLSASGTFITAVTFECYAPVSAGQFNIPSWVLLALPASTAGGLNMSNQTNPQSFTASGLDYAYVTAAALTDISVTYQ